MAYTNLLPGSSLYPDLRLRWAPTTQPTAASQTFTDITSRLRGGAWGYGRNDELGRFEAGRGYVLLDNRDRELDPSNTASAWFGNIKPRRVFELYARWNSVEYPIFTAYSKGFPQEWPAYGVDNVVRVDVIGSEAILQGVDLVVGFTRPAETSGERIDAVLDAIGIPAALRDIDDGTVMVDAITVDAAGTSALDHARTVAHDSEFGQLFMAKDGKVTFHDRHRRLNASVLHAFTDATSGMRYDKGAFQTAWDDNYLANIYRVEGGADSEPYTTTDTAGTADYFPITKVLQTALANMTDREALGNYQADLYSQPLERTTGLPLNGAYQPTSQWPVILDLEVSDRITITRFASASVPKVLTQNVEGISHTFTFGGPWTTLVATSPADTNSYWQLGLAGKSELNTTTRLAP